MPEASIAVDVAAALDFLRRWGAPWVLMAIAVDQKTVDVATFRDPEPTSAWIKTHAQDNIYFHVNPVLRDLDKKAERTDVKALAWLHVDIDPRAGEEIAREQERAEQMLRHPPGDLPRPTVVIFSGGGYQGFWRLQEPVPIDGDLGRAEDAKRYNLQLEILFGADNCHNVDRIMRLPGTINWPTKRKRAKGRVPAVARVVEWDESRVYSLSQFTKAPEVQAAEFRAKRVSAPGNVRRLASVDELPEAMADWAKVLIVQGRNPDEPTKYPSRSEALFAACCELVRAGVDDETIYSVITDPDFLISESVLEKGSSAERYALRQIERAKEEAVAPELRELNEQFAVIGNWGGKCRIIEEVWDEAMGRTRLTKQTFEDFCNRFCNRSVIVGEDKEGNPVRKPLGKWWVHHALRRQYGILVFAPGREVDDAYNLWKGFACEARPGDCSLLLAHVLQNVCSGNEGHYRYLLDWMATAVQEPDAPGYTAVVLRGRRGVGKSFLAKAFGSLWGRHFLHVSDSKHLVGNFNFHLRDCVFLFGDEAFYAGDRRHESVLKTLITEETLAIEAKGVDVEQSPNYVHLMMASNDDWVVPAGFDERRFFVLDVGDTHAQDTAYFGRIQTQLDAGGREALLHMLLTRDTSGVDIRTAPKTEALQEQKEYSMNLEAEWWQAKLEEGRLLATHEGWRTEVVKQELIYDYLQYAKSFGAIGRKANPKRLYLFLRKACPEGGFTTIRRRTPIEATMIDGTRQVISIPNCYVFAPLDACRKHWEDNFGGRKEWPEAVEVAGDEMPF